VTWSGLVSGTADGYKLEAYSDNTYTTFVVSSVTMQANATSLAFNPAT
jgi:hypothetical protein